MLFCKVNLQFIVWWLDPVEPAPPCFDATHLEQTCLQGLHIPELKYLKTYVTPTKQCTTRFNGNVLQNMIFCKDFMSLGTEMLIQAKLKNIFLCLAWDQVYILTINSRIFCSWLSMSFQLIIVVLNSALNFGGFWFSKQPKMYENSPQKRPLITQSF